MARLVAWLKWRRVKHRPNVATDVYPLMFERSCRTQQHVTRRASARNSSDVYQNHIVASKSFFSSGAWTVQSSCNMYCEHWRTLRSSSELSLILSKERILTAAILPMPRSFTQPCIFMRLPFCFCCCCCCCCCSRIIKGPAQSARVDLYVNGELLVPADDKKLISQVPLRDRTVGGRSYRTGFQAASSKDPS